MTTTYEVSRETANETATAKARILFATDPICSHCWAMEPAWRRFLYHYGDHVEATHLYGGLLPRWEGSRTPARGSARPRTSRRTGTRSRSATASRSTRRSGSRTRWIRPTRPRWPCTRCAPSPRAARTTTCVAFGRRSSWRRATSRGATCSSRAPRKSGWTQEEFAAALDDPASQAAFEADLEAKARIGIRGFPTLIVVGPGSEQPWVMRGCAAVLPAGARARGRARRAAPAREASAAKRCSGSTAPARRGSSRGTRLDEEATEAALREAGARSREVAGSRLWFVD